MGTKAYRGRRVAVVGVGYSPFGRSLGMSPLALTSISAKAALDDAGLAPADLDGVVTFSAVNHAAAKPTLLSAQDVASMLGVPGGVGWYQGVAGPAFSAAFLAAIAAVASGSTEVCLAVRTILKDGATPAMTPPATAYGGDAEFIAPFGGFISPIWGAVLWQRHNALYGTNATHTGTQAIAQRDFAVLNEQAIRRTPLTMEEYLGSRFVSKPIRLFDCDYPVDASASVIITTEERARDLKKKPVFIESWSFGSPEVSDFYLLEDLDDSAPHIVARNLFGRSELTPDDVDVAGLYDGQISHTLLWLEALGFCGRGECGDFVLDGHTRLGGKLPVNCDGGAVNIGRVHGANHFIEVVRQLRGECGERQTPNARAGVSTNAIGMLAAGALMVTD